MGLTLPPRFEQCSKKQTIWYGRASPTNQRNKAMPPCVQVLKSFLKMEVLQTQITAMAAAGDAAQEKVLKLVFYLSHFMLNLNYCSNVQGGTVSEGFTFAASDT